MGLVLDDAAVYVVIAVRNGFRHIYGDVLFANEANAAEAAERAKSEGYWDDARVTKWSVV